MVVLIIVATLLFITAIAIATAGSRDSASQTHARQLDQRVRSAEQKVHEIGQRTRAAIIAEAKRRQEQGKP